MLDLEAIKRRAQAATPGPWTTRISEPYLNEGYTPDCYGIDAEDGTSIVITDCGYYPPEIPDAEFIAHAREDIPALVAEVERLRRDNEELERAYAAACRAHNER